MRKGWNQVSPAPALPCGSFEEKRLIVNEDEPRMDTNRTRIDQNTDRPASTTSDTKMFLQYCAPGAVLLGAREDVVDDRPVGRQGAVALCGDRNPGFRRPRWCGSRSTRSAVRAAPSCSRLPREVIRACRMSSMPAPRPASAAWPFWAPLGVALHALAPARPVAHLPDLPGLHLALVEEGPLLDPDGNPLRGPRPSGKFGDPSGCALPWRPAAVAAPPPWLAWRPSRRSSRFTSSTRAWRRARSISRSFITTWERPPCRKQAKGSGAKNRVDRALVPPPTAFVALQDLAVAPSSDSV